ncbi:MAG TPA: HNH endonuclease [Aquimonas sp.]|nr:HNH endonuclease [Aquimonas sp.]
MATKPIDRLMFTQGGLCFFCNGPLSKADASVEHLVPVSRAGSNSDENCVVCCKAVNALFGSMSLKEKIGVILKQKGHFVCPSKASATSPPADTAKAPPKIPVVSKVSSSPKVDHYNAVLADLKKRGASRPRKMETLRNTIRSVVKQAKGSLSEAQLDTLIKHLQANGKIKVEGTSVSYSLS